MSQNDSLLIAKGLPILSSKERRQIRSKWQNETWDDMIQSLHQYGKYIMLRPTGFGKTYTCARAINIGGAMHDGKTLLLNNGNTIIDNRLANIHKKKVIFVYVSEILRITYELALEKTFKNPEKYEGRVQFETYAMVQRHWGDPDYLHDKLDIDNVGLVIFDEVQRLGAKKTSKALDIAIPILDKLGIYYIGATATVDRTTGHDVCDKYFTYMNDDKKTYCWGEHLYTLGDTFESGLIIPPEYVYIEENNDLIAKARQTKESMLKNLKAKKASITATYGEQEYFDSMNELNRAVIKNSSKIIHDEMLKLYDCDQSYITDTEELPKAKFNSLAKPENLYSYMRFLVFAPDRAAITANYRDYRDKNVYYGSLRDRTVADFEKAFGRYGYKVRSTVITSLNAEERSNVKLLARDNDMILDEDTDNVEDRLGTPDKTIDLIFSINMLNIGYHVEHITGLIFKRWTGSNQIYYQQLGRCLSAVSDNIPIVFDFVNSISDKGINAPLYTVSGSNSITTRYADGTSDKDNLKEYDRDDVSNINVIDAKYITVGTTSATAQDILNRCNVYQKRIFSIGTFLDSYKAYQECFSIDTVKRRINNEAYDTYGNPAGVPSIEGSMRRCIIKRAQTLDGRIPTQNEINNTVTMNFKEYLNYLKVNEKDIYVDYKGLKGYVQATANGSQMPSESAEINSILAISKSPTNSKGINVKVMVHDNDVEEFKQDKEVAKLLKSIQFNHKTDIFKYDFQKQ